MPPRRRILNFNTPLDGYQGGKAGNKDPRSFISGNVPGQQWDIQQFAQADRSIQTYGEPPQYSAVHSEAPKPEVIVRSVPTRLTMVPYYVNLVTINEPLLVLRKNIRRLALIVCNETPDTFCFSFGPFIQTGGIPFGRVLPGTSNAEYFGATVPTDDIFIMDLTAPPVGGRLALVYEGIEALESNT